MPALPSAWWACDASHPDEQVERERSHNDRQDVELDPEHDVVIGEIGEPRQYHAEKIR